MSHPLPVTDEDVLAAWDIMYASDHHAPRQPHPKDLLDQHMLKSLRAVIESDRKRVAERSAST